MSRLENLRQVTENTLHNLNADDALRIRILQKAAKDEKPSGQSFRIVPVLCAVCAVLLICVLSLNALQPVPSAGPGDINVFAAGKSETENAHIFPDGFDTGSVTSVSLDGLGTVSDPEQCSALTAILINRSSIAAMTDISDQNRLVFADANGITCTFSFEAPCLIDENDRCWTCPEFFVMLENLF